MPRPHTLFGHPPMWRPQNQDQDQPEKYHTPPPFTTMPQDPWNYRRESSMEQPPPYYQPLSMEQLSPYYHPPSMMTRMEMLPHQWGDSSLGSPHFLMTMPQVQPPHLLHLPLVGNWEDIQAQFAEREKRRTELSGMDDEECEKRLVERLSKRMVSPVGPDGYRMVNNLLRHKHAKMALEFYEKTQDAEFEMVEALYSDQSLLVVPEDSYSQEWCHVSFIAKPKNTDSPQYFFAELFSPGGSREFNVKYCSTFEPSDDPGFKHGCVLCSPDQKFHPGVDGYRIGAPPCSVVPMLYG